MESILQGWLTKSPPEKKQFKLFGAKWRKRYFVLYAPPSVDGIPDAFTALLEYYSSKKLQSKCGTINLADCEEVLSNLDSDIYKHVFGLRTMHKSQLRTYYLAAETEPEMNKWVSKLCQVLGLKENDDDVGSSQSLFPNRTTQPLRIPGSMRQPFTRPLTHQSHLGLTGVQSPAPPPPRPVPSMPNIPFTRLNMSEPNLLDATLPRNCMDTRRETVEVGWQFSSPPGSSKMASPPGSSQMRNAESFPELDCFSPVNRKPGSEGRELPPIPPEKTGPKVIAEAEADVNYDLPKQKYYERCNSEDQTSVKNSDCYNLPRVRNNNLAAKEENGVGWNSNPPTSQASDDWYNLPKNLAAVIDDSYNIPKSHLDKRKHTSQGEEFYNIPKPQGSDWQDISQLPQKKTNRRSYGGQRLVHQEYTGSSDQMENYDVPKSKLSDQNYEDDYNVPKSALAHRFTQKDQDISRSERVSGFGVDLYNLPKHQDLPLDRPKCLWERNSVQGALNGKQQLDDQIQTTPVQAFHSIVSGSIPSSLLPTDILPPEKPPRPLSRPSPDRQIVDGRPVSSAVDQLFSTLQSDFKSSCLPAEEKQDEDSGMSDNTGSSELKKTPSNTFKQNKSTVQSSSSIHKRQVASNLPIHDSIRFTQRTKSFKRSIPSQDRSALPLPVKRIVERSESSSSASSDEDGDHSVVVQGN